MILQSLTANKNRRAAMIRNPSDPQLQELADLLRESAASEWPANQLHRCGIAGFYRWFVDESAGGLGWCPSDIARGYLELSSACMTTTFALTQRVAALKRIAGCQNDDLRNRMLPSLLDGSITATVGISHLTTSRRHLKSPVMSAERVEGGFRVDGFSPWVTGGAGADYILMGAQIVSAAGKATEQQILFVVKSSSDSIHIEPAQELVALSATQTGPVKCDSVFVPQTDVLAGPIENVLAGNGGGAGGLQTSVLALGLVKSAIEFVEDEASRRGELAITQDGLRSQYERLKKELFAATDAQDSTRASDIRTKANSLALRATQAALVVAKGAGFVAGHPVGRWCSEALFFLVWSCPQTVADANLTEFATCRIG